MSMGHPANLINQNHPSFGAKSMWFLFATQVNGSYRRMLLVEAKNPWAIQCMERILGSDQRVSPTCHCILVFRDCDIGRRHDMAEEISLQEFVETMVEPSRLLDDSCTVQALTHALAPERPVAVVRALPPPKKTEQKPEPKKSAEKTEKNKEEPAKEDANTVALRSKLSGVLSGMGFKADQYGPVVRALDVNSGSDINTLVRLSLQKLVA